MAIDADVRQNLTHIWRAFMGIGLTVTVMFLGWIGVSVTSLQSQVAAIQAQVSGVQRMESRIEANSELNAAQGKELQIIERRLDAVENKR